MKEKETNSQIPLSVRLRYGEELLWLSQSEPMSLMKPFMVYLKICAVWGLILFAIALFFQMMYSVGGAGYGREDEAQYLLIDAFPPLLLASMPVILIVYGLYWLWTYYEPVAVYVVTTERLIMRQGWKTTTWTPDEIKKIEIVGDESWGSMTFTRVGGAMITWHDISGSNRILDMIRAQVKTPIFVDYIQG